MTDDRNAGGGGMTGATGDLTPDAMRTRPFVPAETREIADPDQRADVTQAQGGVPSAADAARGPREPDLGGDERVDHEGHF